MVVCHKNSISYLEELKLCYFFYCRRKKKVYHSNKLRKENKSKLNKYMKTFSINKLFTRKITLKNFTGYFCIAV